MQPAAEPAPRAVRRVLDGVLLLDKPPGPGSTAVLARVKSLYRAEKAGHTGTLDPFASGLLPLCLGEATKFSADLLDADKCYRAMLRLGVSTSTGDPEGQVIKDMPVQSTREQIEHVLARFRGAIAQRPPMFSALKRDGQPLYAYARQGLTLDRDLRAVTIHDLQVLAYDVPYLSIEVCCSKGTYIRTLAEDIGQALGCGAHLHTLRRLAVAGLRVEDARTLDQLEALSDGERLAALLPIDALLSSLPRIQLDRTLAERFQCGQRLAMPASGAAMRVAVYGDAQAGAVLLGVAVLDPEGVLRPQRLINGRPIAKA